MGKAARVPAALVRGVEPGRPAATGRRDRPAARGGPVPRRRRSCRSRQRRTIRSFGAGDVAREVVEEAVRAAARPRRRTTRGRGRSPRSGRRPPNAGCSARSRRRGGPICAATGPRGHDRAPDREERRGPRRRARPDRALGAVRRRTPVPGRRACARRAGDVPALGRRRDPEPPARAARAGRRVVLDLLDAVLSGGDASGARDARRSGSRSAPSRPARCRREPRRRGRDRPVRALGASLERAVRAAAGRPGSSALQDPVHEVPGEDPGHDVQQRMHVPPPAAQDRDHDVGEEPRTRRRS